MHNQGEYVSKSASIVNILNFAEITNTHQLWVTQPHSEAYFQR